MSQQANFENEIIPFLRKRDYRLVKELGQGACGKTVLLHDESIDELYVCKKYTPHPDLPRAELFSSFVRETKLLYQVFHENVVRVYNHYLYPEHYAGFILMEYIEGRTVAEFVADAPDVINELFEQAVSGFAYLQRKGILHRDIRIANLMVRNDKKLKIIDLGFGKRVETSDDFDKSIDLNWWCQTPDEFGDSRYDFQTEVYFVGKLFERLIQDNNIQSFKNIPLLSVMCRHDPNERISSFVEVETEIQATQISDVGFDASELATYRRFADTLRKVITKIDSSAEYLDDAQLVAANLNEVYRSFMLEEFVPNPAVVIRCLLRGTYYYQKNGPMTVADVKDFLRLLQNVTLEKKRIILANIHTKLNAMPRYAGPPDEEIPF